MLLKSVTTFGFKSFADKIELGFGPGITAVVGPNGSGKSNVSDAVRWVLGEQSAKYLRGSKMEDVIFSGTSKRRPLNVAEVNLIFDNTDHSLPLDFEEVSITRRLFRSGDSEYAINKKNCRLKDILDLLADTGLGRGSMSIIGQNKIDEILNSRPEDRRAIFEEAAGIAKYRLRKKEAGRRLEETANNLTRINDIKSEVESQVEPLRLEAEKTRQYNELSGQLRICKLTQFVRKVETIEDARKKLAESRQEAQDLVAAKSTAVSSKEASCTQLQQEIDKLNDAYSRMQEGIKEKETSLENVKGQSAVLDERVKQSLDNSSRLEVRGTKLAQQITEWNTQLETLAGEYDKYEQGRQEAEVKVKDLTAAQSAKEDAVKTSEARVQELTESNFEDMRQLVEMRNQIRSLETEQEQRMNRREALKNTAAGLEAKIAELQEQQREANDTKGSLEQAVSQYLKDGLTLKTQSEEQGKKLAAVETKYQACQQKITALESRLTILKNMQKNFEGFNYGSRSILQAREPWSNQVSGVVAQLLTVKPEHVTAIETALGAGAQDIVLETAQAAKAAIAYLKERHGGRTTFLPLDTVKAPNLRPEEERLAQLPGICGFASDLAGFEAKVAPAIRSLLGRVLVAEEMDAALKAARQSGFRLRVVTLQGDVVNAGGSMTGGSRPQKEAGYLSREKEISEQEGLHGNLSRELLGYQEEREQLEASQEELITKMDKLRTDIQERQVRLAQIDASLQQFKTSLTEENQRLELALSDRRRLAEEYMAKRQELQELRPRLTELENQNAEGKAELDKLQQQIQADNAALNTLRNRLQAALVEKENLATQSKVASERMQELDNNLGRLQDEQSGIEEEKAKMQAVVAVSKRKKEELEVRSAQLLQELQKIVNGKDDFSAQRVQLTEQHAVAEEQLAALRREQEQAAGKLRQNDVDNVKLDSDYQHAMETLATDYKITIEEAKNSGLLRDQSDTALHRSQLQLEREISALGAVNAGAIEQYKAVSERFEFLQKQYSDLMEAKDSLEAVISEINAGMAKRFQEAFGKINEFFAEAYVRLFGGGTAVLSLADPEDILESGIDIEVQPPGKKLQSLYLLSGGERALTVIALLFALLSYKPSPFCILDEIDAPLDDANIERFASFLKSYAENTQFIVITHRKGTMEAADIMYGITMEESGVSKLLSVKMDGKEEEV